MNETTERIWWHKYLNYMENYFNNGRDWYFPYGDDNKMAIKYILSIT